MFIIVIADFRLCFVTAYYKLYLLSATGFNDLFVIVIAIVDFRLCFITTYYKFYLLSATSFNDLSVHKPTSKKEKTRKKE